MVTNPDQRTSWKENPRLAEDVAARLPLIHVTGGMDNGRPSFLRLLSGNPPQIPTSADTGYCSDLTRQTEDRLGLPRSVYFYAGRACPEFGEVALAFPPAVEDGHTGSATPFDTGGMFHPDPERRIRVDLGVANDDAGREKFVRDSVVPQSTWRRRFAGQLAAYFDPLTDYWVGRPRYEDPEKLHTLNQDWRAWTWEVRFAEPQPLSDRSACCFSKKMGDYLRQVQEDLPVSRRAPLDDFLAQPRLNAVGTPDYDKVIETWARQQVNL